MKFVMVLIIALSSVSLNALAADELPAEKVIDLVGAKYINNPPLGSLQYGLVRADGLTVAITCGRLLRGLVDYVGPAIMVAARTEVQEPLDAIVPVQSSLSCVGRIQPVFEKMQSGAKFSLLLSKPKDGHYSQLEFQQRQ